jgi:hypothetical protein
MTDTRRDPGEPAGPGPDDVDAARVRPDAGPGTRDAARDVDQGARDWDEEEAVRTGEIATNPEP